MAHHNFIPALLALAAASGVGTSAAQSVTERVLITGRSAPQVAGFGSQPLARSPLQASVIGAEALADAGTLTLAGLSAFDASVSDAYSSEGYWSQFSVRGFVLDPRSNYRRDGLPINAETALLLANKERVEVLEGISGTQAGVSAPGGLVNLVTKRPTRAVRSVQLGVVDGGTLVVGADLGDRFGAKQQFGLRLNVEAAQLHPQTRDADGTRRLWALAGDWQLTPDTRLEAEVESSHQSQPSVAGFSLLGNSLPDAGSVDPRVNINNQPWRLPVVLDGNTASLRWRQRLSADWQLSAHGMTQRLVSDDRMAFPFGCYDAGADVYYADRYCPDGSLDLYDFRSENERRRSDALDLQFAGSLRTGSVAHELSTGVLWTRHTARFQRQAFNYAGSGRDDGSVIVPAAPELTDENTDRDERSTEFYLRDAMQLGEAGSLWAGLRQVRLERASVRTDGSRAIDYTQSFTTPWLGLGWQLSPQTFVYASWGQGIETDVVPNRARYTNAGQPLPALKSRQFEAGIKHAAGRLDAGLVAFSIVRPLAADLGSCDDDASCTRRIDGEARHQGLEASLGGHWGAWQLSASAMWLNAERRGASDAALNGLRPTNVPAQTFKAQVGYLLTSVPGLQLQARLVREGSRIVVPDNSVEAPGWTRADLGARWAVTLAGRQTVLRLGIDNVTDAQGWRETPYQFGHAYLFPLAPRTWRASITFDLL